MGIASIVLAVLAFLCMFGGFLLSWVPVLGGLLSFGAPLLALAGIVVGGIGMSRSKRDGTGGGPAIAGLILSILAFLPAAVVALTCGLCNACVTAGMMSPHGKWGDGGVRFYYHPLHPVAPPGADGGPGTAPPSGPQPPPAFPAPPLGPSSPQSPSAPGSQGTSPSPSPPSPGAQVPTAPPSSHPAGRPRAPAPARAP